MIKNLSWLVQRLDRKDNMSDQNQTPTEDRVVRIGRYNVKVVRRDCIGAATCVAISPNVFELDNANIAVIKDGASDSEENLLAAAQGCPTKAIIITDAETGEMIWPK